MEPGLAELGTLDVFTLGAAQQYADVVACLTLVKQFADISTPVQVVLTWVDAMISTSSPT